MHALRTPYAVVTSVERPQLVTERELLGISRRLEATAMALSPPSAVAAALQDHRFLTPRMRDVHRRLASAGASVTLLARGCTSGSRRACAGWTR